MKFFIIIISVIILGYIWGEGLARIISKEIKNMKKK